MRAIQRKLWRDIWHYRGQLVAIVAVVACGIALFVSLRSMHGYLRDSRDGFYLTYRFADVFAPLKRAPLSVARRAEELPGIQAAEPRIVFDVTLDVPRLEEPAVGRMISIPVPRAPMLNELHLLGGRWPLADEPDAVIASAAFSRANRLMPGDSVGAVLHGRWRWLRIVGIAISPEYVYELATASVFPDNKRFGVLWLSRATLATAFGMEGAFNDLVVTLRPDASPVRVIPELDALLERYGGVGAYPRADQVSHQFVEGEIEETQVTSILLPAIFLTVTAFLLHIVVSRLVGTQREQIAMLKSFGYSRLAITTHYLAFALAPMIAGSLVGTAAGLWVSDQLAVVYARFFQFPSAGWVVDWGIVTTAVGVGGGAGLVGALQAVNRSASLPPAEAMRPESPAQFRPGVVERLNAVLRTGPVTRIIARNIGRRPARAMLSVIGLALAGGLVITVLSMFDAIDFMKKLQFNEVMREDVMVVFESARPTAAVREIERLPGVLQAEGFRAVPVRLRHGGRDHRTAILGLDRSGVLRSIVDANQRHRQPPAAGLLVSSVLSNILHAQPGDRVRIEVLEGERPSFDVDIAGITNELVGTSAYMEADALRRLIGGASAVSGAFLVVDERRAESLYSVLKRLPAVAGVSVRAVQLEGFEQTIAESFNIMLAALLGFSLVIAFGVVYNSARVSLSERGRELASLRVLGFTRGEVTAMLLGEQAVLMTLAVPVGFLVAYFLAWLISVRFESQLFRIPVVIQAASYLSGVLTIVVAGFLSALAVRGRIARLDLVAVLKTRE
jgi:putative ABC transport system permease protein